MFSLITIYIIGTVIFMDTPRREILFIEFHSAVCIINDIPMKQCHRELFRRVVRSCCKDEQDYLVEILEMFMPVAHVTDCTSY